MRDERAPAAGVDRQVPSRDVIAHDYLLLALRLDKLLPGIVDAYFGPAGLKAQVQAEAPLAPARLREQAPALLSRLPREIQEPDRLRWLTAQLVSLEAQAVTLAGDPLPYSECVACLFDVAPERPSETIFDAAADDLARLLPSGRGDGETVSERLAAWESRFAFHPARLPAVVDWLVREIRDRADRLLGLPAGEAVEVAYVSDRLWRVDNQYRGGCRTRIEINVDLLRTPAELVQVVAREAYPGRHTERALRDRRLVDGLGRLEASILLLNTPEALVSEGMAYLGGRLVGAQEGPARTPARALRARGTGRGGRPTCRAGGGRDAGPASKSGREPSSGAGLRGLHASCRRRRPG